MFPIADELPDLSKFEIKPKPSGGDDSVARVVDDELSTLGWSENARLSLLGDLGRENGWNRETIFNGHGDPKNNELNRGIISWQGKRREKLDKFLQKEGVYGKRDDDELRGMVRFMDDEMKSSSEWQDIHKAVRNTNISTYDASENLRKYIKYVPNAPYNSPDGEFRVKNNRKWAEKAKNLGLGKLPDLTEFEADNNLPDLSAFEVNTENNVPQPTFPGQVMPEQIVGQQAEVNRGEFGEVPQAQDILPAYVPNNPTEIKRGLETDLSKAKSLIERKRIKASLTKLDESIGEQSKTVTPSPSPVIPPVTPQLPGGLTDEQSQILNQPLQPVRTGDGTVLPSPSVRGQKSVKGSVNGIPPEKANEPVDTGLTDFKSKDNFADAGTELEEPTGDKSIVVKNDNDLLKTKAGTVRVDLSKMPRDIDAEEYVFRAAIKALAPRFGITDEQIETAVTNLRANGLPLLENADQLRYLVGEGSQATVNSSPTREVINSILTGGKSEISETVRADYKKRQADADMRLLTSDAPVQYDNLGQPVKAREISVLQNEKIRAEAEAEAEARKSVEDSIRNPSISEAATKGLDKGIEIVSHGVVNPLLGLYTAFGDAKDAYNLDGRFKRFTSEDDIQGETLNRLETIHRTYGNFSEYQKEQKELARLYSGGLEDSAELTGRLIRQGVRTFAKGLSSDQLRGIETVSALMEDIIPGYKDLPVNARNLGNTIAAILGRARFGADAQIKLADSDSDIDKRLFSTVADQFDKAIGEDRTLRETFAGQMADALGSAGSFIVLGMLGGAAGISSKISSGVGGAVQTAGSMYKQGKEDGLSEKDSRFAALAGIPIGATEALGIGGQLDKFLTSKEKGILIKGLVNRLKKYGRDLTPEMFEEGLQELLQGVSEDSTFGYLKDSDPSRYNRIMTAIRKIPALIAKNKTNALIGALSGGVTQIGFGAVEKLTAEKEAGNSIRPMPTAPNIQQPNADALKGNEIVSPIKAREQVRKLSELGYSDSQIDSLSQSDREVITKADVTPDVFAQLTGNKLDAPVQNDDAQKPPPIGDRIRRMTSFDDGGYQFTEDVSEEDKTTLIRDILALPEDEKPDPKLIAFAKAQTSPEQPADRPENIGEKTEERQEIPIVEESEKVDNLSTKDDKLSGEKPDEKKQEQPASVTQPLHKKNEQKPEVLTPTGKISGLPSHKNPKFERFKLPAKKDAENVQTEQKPPREFSTTQVDLTGDDAKEVLNLGRSLIKQDDLIEIEDKPHATAAFGLETDNPKDVRSILSDVAPFEIKLGKVSIFDTNPDFDVVKIEVDSPELIAVNKLIKQRTKVTDTQNSFSPHVTLGKVKKGTGAKYIGSGKLEGKTIKFDAITFSDKNRNKISIPLGEKAQKFENALPDSDSSLAENEKPEVSQNKDSYTSSPENTITDKETTEASNSTDKKSDKSQTQSAIKRTKKYESLFFGESEKAEKVSSESAKKQPESAALKQVVTTPKPKVSTSGFYSAVEKSVLEKMPNKASGEQIRNLLNPQKTAGVKQEELDWLGVDDFLSSKDNFTKGEIINFVRENNVELQEVVKRDEDDETKYSQYRLPGGESYKELLLTLPLAKADIPSDWHIKSPSDESRYYRVFETKSNDLLAYGSTEQEAVNTALADSDVKGEVAPYRSSHFDEPNILAHIRFDERTDAAGNRTLHIAEIQSDWAQSQRKGNNAPKTPFFKTEGWAGLAFKRTLRYAVENGFDAISWDTGETNSDRFDLSKSIDSIVYYAKPDGVFRFAAIKNGVEVAGRNRATPEELAELIGKEMVKKFQDGDGETLPNGDKSLSGLDLNVGGKGMKIFYDQIVPSFVSKYVKKWGARINQAEVSSNVKTPYIEETENGFEVFDSEGKPAKTFTEKEAAQDYLEDSWSELNKNQSVKIHSVSITPAMRTSVMDGQPLFKIVGNRNVQDEALQRELRDKVKSELLPAVESEAKGDSLKLSLEAGEIVRIVTAMVNDEDIETSPDIAGLFLNDEAVAATAEDLSEIIRMTEERGLDAGNLIKLKENLLLAAEENGTVVVKVYDDAESHERIHQASYLNSHEKELSERHARFDELVNLKSDDGEKSIVDKAFDEFFVDYGYSAEDKGTLVEEMSAYIATGDYAILGLSEDEAALFIETWLDSYVERNGTKILDNIEELIDERVKETGVIGRVRQRGMERGNRSLQRTEGRREPGSDSGVSSLSESETRRGESIGDTDREQGLKKERQTILSAEKAGLIEKDSITGDARYYTEKSRNENERKAQEKIEEIGLTKAHHEAVTKQPTEGERAEHIALQQEVSKLLNRQSNEAADAGNLVLAKAKLAESHEVVSAMAELGTDYGQAISQFANLQKTDPEAVTGYVQTRRAQKQYNETLTPEESKILRESAEALQTANAELEVLQNKIAELEKQLEEKKPRRNPVQKTIAEDLKKSAAEAAARLREKFDPPSKSNQVLKMAIPLADKRTAQLDPDTLKDFSTVGASILLTGPKEKPVSIVDFKNQLKDLFGADVLPHIAEIHALSVRELKKIKSDAYRASAVEALRNVEGNEDLTVEDLNAIVEQKTEERKENAKVRGENVRESNKFFKEKEKADRLDDLPNFAKSLFKVADTQNKEALVGALYLETGQVKTADELARKLREAFPELSPREALNTASVAARSRRLAHEDLKAEKEKIKKTVVASIIEAREAKKKRNEAQRQLLNRIKYLESPPPSYSERLGRVYKAALVSAVQTQVNNFLTAQGTRKIVAATDLFEVIFNKGLAKVGLEYDYDNKLSSETRFQDVAGLPNSEDRSAAGVVKHFFSDAVFARGIANSVLDEYPTFFEAMFGSYSSDVAVVRDRKGADGAVDWTMQKIEKTYEKVNVLGYLQEFLVRSQEFNHALQLRLGQKGLNLTDVIKNDKIVEQISEADLQFAVDRALTVTFALKADKKSGFGKLVNLYQEHTPGVVSPFLVTFPNFLYNATKFVTDYAPAIGLAKAGAKAIKSDDAFGQALLKEVNPRVISQQLVGTALFLAAFALVRGAGDDDKWYYLKTPFTGADGKNFYIDVRGYQPFASMVFLANKVNRAINDKPMFSDRDTAVIETLEAMTGFSTRNLEESKFAQMAYYAFAGSKAKDDKDWERVWFLAQQQLGEIGGGFLRPLKTVKDLVAQFDEFEAKQPDLIDRPGSQGIARSLPFSNRILQLEARKDFVTGKESSQPAPILKILGVNLINPDFHKEIPSKALVALRDMTDNFKSEKDPLPESQRKALTKGSLYRAMREAGDDKEKQKKVNEAIRRAEEKGILEAGELEFIERQKGLSELENLAKRLKPEQVERVLKFATDKEKSLLTPILDAKTERKEKEKEKVESDKLINQVRRGEVSFDDADKMLAQQLEAGKISEKQYKERLESTAITEKQEEAKNLDASSNADFSKLENFVRDLAPEDREGVYNILLEKTVQKLKAKDAKTLSEAERLYKVIEDNFADFEKKESTKSPKKFADLDGFADMPKPFSLYKVLEDKYKSKLFSYRKSENVIDLRQNRPLYEFLESMKHNDKKSGDAWLKDLMVMELSAAEINEINKALRKYKNEYYK